MTLRVCAEPGCPTLTKRTRCETHERAKDAARGRRQARGYDAAYDNERRHYEKRMLKGERLTCWSCHHPIDPFMPWDLGHCARDRRVIHGLQHRACNRDTSNPLCSHISHVT